MKESKYTFEIRGIKIRVTRKQAEALIQSYYGGPLVEEYLLLLDNRRAQIPPHEHPGPLFEPFKLHVFGR